MAKKKKQLHLHLNLFLWLHLPSQLLPLLSQLLHLLRQLHLTLLLLLTLMPLLLLPQLPLLPSKPVVPQKSHLRVAFLLLECWRKVCIVGLATKAIWCKSQAIIHDLLLYPR